MNSEIRMSLVMNLLTLLLSAVLVRSDQSSAPLRSFKIGGNVTYDCIDIYKQPGLDHPLLKNHILQLKPSDSRHESKNQTGNNKTYKERTGCPDGTVPILRNSKEYNTEKYFHPLTADSPGTHIAGVRTSQGPFRGIEANFNTYNLNIGQDQASYSQIYLGSGFKNQVNFIQAGFMINPSQYGDSRVWTYGYWKGKDGKGCYNTACYGFVQVSKVVPIVQPLDIKPGEYRWMSCSIHQDKQTGNWWITLLSQNSRPDIDIGYWPKELFNLLDNGASMVGAGGVVQATKSGSSPPMGNGQFPTKNQEDSALFANVGALKSNYVLFSLDSFATDNLIDSPKCYGLRVGHVKWYKYSRLGYFFNYGGPGGNSCGV